MARVERKLPMLFPSEAEAIGICWPDPDSLPMFYLLGLIPEASTEVAQDEDAGDVEAGLCRVFIGMRASVL